MLRRSDRRRSIRIIIFTGEVLFGVAVGALVCTIIVQFVLLGSHFASIGMQKTSRLAPVGIQIGEIQLMIRDNSDIYASLDNNRWYTVSSDVSLNAFEKCTVYLYNTSNKSIDLEIIAYSNFLTFFSEEIISIPPGVKVIGTFGRGE